MLYSYRLPLPPFAATRRGPPLRLGAVFSSSTREKRVSFSRRIAVAAVSNEEWSCVPPQDQVDFDSAQELFGADVGVSPRNLALWAPKPKSWIGPNGQYVRELPCPTCRGRGYTPCSDCGIERSRFDCPNCSGKGLMTCSNCFGECVIWEESIDEGPWEKARSSSPLKVKEDDEVDNLEIKLDPTRKSKRVYQSPPPEVNLKISRSLRSLNAKTGLFSNRMKIIHQDPKLHAQRVAAIKKAKGTDAARKRTSETLQKYFSDPENRRKRSISMKGVKYFCSNCGKEGHRLHYCPELKNKVEGRFKYKCRICSEKGHNRRTCPELLTVGSQARLVSSKIRHCSLCGEKGHNRRSCTKKGEKKVSSSMDSEAVGVVCEEGMTRGHAAEKSQTK